MTLPIFVAIAAAVAVMSGTLWAHLTRDVRQPLLVYLGSYFITYAIGGIWIGLTDGEALVSYFRDRLYIPNIAAIGTDYWLLLLAPLVIPIAVAWALSRGVRRPGPTQQSASWTSVGPALVRFGVLFAVLAGYAVFRIFHSGTGLIDAFMNISGLYGDTTTIVERRFELFDPGTTAAFGLIYGGLPALCHVALFQARRGGPTWRAVCALAIVATIGLSLATFQIAPAVVFIAALLISASHLQLIRMTPIKSFALGVTFLLLVQGMNVWKFGDWTFVDNLRHLVFRMPAAYPYYLDCFPGTIPFLGADWLGALTGRGADPGSPFIVARFMYTDALAGGAMAAPAHVQAYAEGGVLYAVASLVAVGVAIWSVALLERRSRAGAMAHALYIQGIVTLYYLTQTSFRGVIWHSYGLLWSAVALAVMFAASLGPNLRPTVAVVPSSLAPLPRIGFRPRVRVSPEGSF